MGNHVCLTDVSRVVTSFFYTLEAASKSLIPSVSRTKGFGSPLGAGEAGPLTGSKYNSAYDLMGETRVSYDDCCSFWRGGRSLSEHSGVLRTLAVLQFRRTGALFSLLRVVFPTIQPVVFTGTTWRMFGSRSFGGHFKPKV